MVCGLTAIDIVSDVLTYGLKDDISITTAIIKCLVMLNCKQKLDCMPCTRAVSWFTIFCLNRYRDNDMIIENRNHFLTIHLNDSQMPDSAWISKVLVLSGHL